MKHKTQKNRINFFIDSISCFLLMQLLKKVERWENIQILIIKLALLVLVLLFDRLVLIVVVFPAFLVVFVFLYWFFPLLHSIYKPCLKYWYSFDLKSRQFLLYFFENLLKFLELLLFLPYDQEKIAFLCFQKRKRRS